MDIEKEIEIRRIRIEEQIRGYMPKESGLQQTVLDAMEYSVFAGGKRLRPMLMEASYQMMGGTDEKLVEPFMAAIEMIHTYSLVHDDLPAMDNDDYRRGKETTHKRFGEAMGILAGDALLNYAYETIGDAVCAQKDTDKKERMVQAFSVIAKKAGIYGMVGGQTVDVESEERQIPLDLYMLDFMYRLKTAALMEASLMTGAVLAGAPFADVASMETAGTKLGMAFQIMDDILDVTSTQDVLGKPVGSDERNQKTTYVNFGIGRAEEEVKRLSSEAVEILDGFEGEHTFLRELFLYLIHREK